MNNVKLSIEEFLEDAESWGNALNEAGWVFIDHNPENSALLFNTAKASLREALFKYAKCVFEKYEFEQYDKFIRCFEENVYVWYDESGLVGGAASSYLEAKEQLKSYMKSLG